MSEKLTAFDAGDPFDAMAESFKAQVADMALAAAKAAIYRDMEPTRQVECFMAGVMTGLLGVCFAHIMPEGRDEMMNVIEAYLPQARLNAEEMINPALRSLFNGERDGG